MTFGPTLIVIRRLVIPSRKAFCLVGMLRISNQDFFASSVSGPVAEYVEQSQLTTRLRLQLEFISSGFET